MKNPVGLLSQPIQRSPLGTTSSVGSECVFYTMEHGPLWSNPLLWCHSFVFVFHSHDLTRTCFPGMYRVLPWECSCPKGGIIRSVINLVYYQPSYNTSHTMKPSDPLLLANVTLRCGMYPAGKVDISRHLAIPGFPQSDHTVSKPSADAGSLYSEV